MFGGIALLCLHFFLKSRRLVRRGVLAWGRVTATATKIETNKNGTTLWQHMSVLVEHEGVVAPVALQIKRSEKVPLGIYPVLVVPGHLENAAVRVDPLPP